MPMNQVIREKRKELELTQEQIAEYLGVSTPAVNKWESGATCPDIALLPALARLLRTDLNTLLCFNEALSDQEISCFCKEVAETIQKNGFTNGFDKAAEKIQEYPNCFKLIHKTALILEGSLIMAGMSAADKENYSARITALYERAVKSEDEQIRQTAVYMLASKYMAQGNNTKAQEMLDLLPESNAMDKRQLQANLWIKQGKLTEAAELLERKMLMLGINEIQIILINLANIAVKEGNDREAAEIAEVSRETARFFGLWDYYAYIAPLEVALQKEDVQESLELLKALLAATLEPWKMEKSVLFRHIADKTHREGTGAKMLPGLLSAMESDPKYAFLHANAEFLKLIEQYRAKC